MKFQDTTNIATPEGVPLELTLAGVGSRLTAQLIDGLIKGAVILALALGVASIDLTAFVFVTVALPILFFGYELVFESVWSGRTPGKYATGLQVVRTDGSPVTFTASLVRNLMRVVDFLPAGYGVAVVLVFTTSRNQRLGDLAAGTVVVRVPKQLNAPGAGLGAQVDLPPGFDATAVTPDQLALARSFLTRRDDLDEGAQHRLAEQIAAQLRPSIVDPSNSLQDHELIAAVVAAKSGRGGVR